MLLVVIRSDIKQAVAFGIVTGLIATIWRANDDAIYVVEKKLDTLTKLLDAEELVPDTKPKPANPGPDQKIDLKA